MNDFYKDKRIIYNKDNGFISVVYPAQSFVGSIEDLAKKDVPKGKKFKVINTSDLPEDETFMDAWEVDEKDLTDGVGE